MSLPHLRLNDVRVAGTMFRRRSVSAQWDQSPSRLGWSVFDDRLGQARLVKKGKKLQLRFHDDGTFGFDEGVTAEEADGLIESDRWQLVPMLIEVQSSGTLVATHHSETLGYTLHNRHAELILYRIAQGTLRPGPELIETLQSVPRLKEELGRIDLDRQLAEVADDRMPSKREFGETSHLFMERETLIGGIAATAQATGATQETVDAAVNALNVAIADNPFRLDDTPYLCRQRSCRSTC
jgi:hypothetical protein